MAEQELYDATSYYEGRSPGLGTAFLDEVEHAITQIREYPVAAPQIDRLIWRKLLRRFPYSIMYSVQDNAIRILAIANHKRRPLYWRKRV